MYPRSSQKGIKWYSSSIIAIVFSILNCKSSLLELQTIGKSTGRSEQLAVSFHFSKARILGTTCKFPIVEPFERDLNGYVQKLGWALSIFYLFSNKSFCDHTIGWSDMSGLLLPNFMFCGIKHSHSHFWFCFWFFIRLGNWKISLKLKIGFSFTPPSHQLNFFLTFLIWSTPKF